MPPVDGEKRMRSHSTDTTLEGSSPLLMGVLRAAGLVAVMSLLGCESNVQPLDPASLTVVASRAQNVAIGSYTVYASGLNNPRGLAFGPDGTLYVAEAGAGGTTSTAGLCAQVPSPVGPYLGGHSAQITKISPALVKSTLVSGLPSTKNALGLVSGVSGLEFMSGSLYAIIDGAGCSHGHLDVPNEIIRINTGNGAWTPIANLSAFYQSHPTLNFEPDDFEPDGTPYSMVGVRGDLYVVEPNHGSLDRVSLTGEISRVSDISAQFGHIVPTTVSYHGNFFVGNLNTFGVVPGSSQIIKITPSGEMKTWVPGLTAVLGSAWDERGRLYVLETTTAPGQPAPMTGKVIRVDPSGATTVITDGLFLPTAMTMGPDGNLYVSNVGFGPPPVGLGQVLKIRLN
jgi:hypothetical protein